MAARMPAVIGAQGTSTTPQARSAQPATALARQQTGDRLTQAAQSAAEAATRASRALPIGDGNLITGLVCVGGTPLVIKHQLGAKWRGFIPTNASGNFAIFYVDPTQNGADPGKTGKLDAYQITLVPANACTCDLWVFR